MADSPEFTIKNWGEFQHYKDGRPLRWVKVYISTLDDFEFNALPETAQLHLLKLWLAAGEKAGDLPERPQAEFRIRAQSPVDWALLEKTGFLVRNRTESYQFGTKPYQVSRAEEIRGEERRGEETLGQPKTLTEVAFESADANRRRKWDEMFDKWWSDAPAPRKVQKAAGRRAWARLIPKNGTTPEVRYERILHVTRARWGEWEKREQDKRPHAATFLRSEEF